MAMSMAAPMLTGESWHMAAGIAVGLVVLAGVGADAGKPPESKPYAVKVDTKAVLGLRCIAALLVAYGNWPIVNGTERTWEDPESGRVSSHRVHHEYDKGLRVTGGFDPIDVAVTLFFVISGFIMTVAYLDRVTEDNDFDLFFMLRRLARLIP